ARPDRSFAHALALASPHQVGGALAGPHWHAPATHVGVAGRATGILGFRDMARSSLDSSSMVFGCPVVCEKPRAIWCRRSLVSGGACPGVSGRRLGGVNAVPLGSL